MSVIFIFLDGVGIGTESKENPFYLNNYESFQILSGENFFDPDWEYKNSSQLYKGIDANLNVEGLPQSGTGQTTLFTGKNASKIIGRHFGPYPHSKIRPVLKEHNIFKDAIKLGKSPYFINAYPPIFFEMAKKRNRWSCTTFMMNSNEIALNSTPEVLNEKALTAEILQNAWRERLNIDLPKITATDAAKRLLSIVPHYDLVLFEYYLTDEAGHSQDFEAANRVLKPLDEFLLYILKNMKSTDTLVITSDHGNIEDLSTKSHTRNKIPLFVFGNNAQSFDEVQSIIGVKESIINNLLIR